METPSRWVLAAGGENGNVRNRWRRWVPGPKHGLPVGVVVFAAGRPDPEHLDELLGQCGQLRTFAQAHGFELDRVPDDIGLLDRAFDEAMGLGQRQLGGPLPIAALANQAGLYLGTVMTATLPGTRWRLWPNGHPVVCLPSGRDLDVVALAHDRASKGVPRLASIYAGAAADQSR